MAQLSRAKRFDEAKAKIEEAKSIFEELQEELQSWLDNLPENLQSSSKADSLNEAIDNLNTIISDCDNIDGTEVEFPGMFS
jgi:predicted RNase H-like nuclease (RuvC/YqgF family)